MTLRSQLRAFPIVVAGAMLILGVALILRVQVMNHALERESGIDRLIYEVSMLKSVILDYQLHESARAMRQWRVIDQRLTASLTALSFTHSHEQRLFERVVSTYSRVQAIVAELQSQPSGSAAVDAAAAPLPGAYTDILVSQLIILSQDVISQSFQLQHRIKQRMITINQATLLMVGGVAAIVVLSVFGISWQVERRLARSINTLIAIAHQIQDGKLEFVVPVAEQDDFQVVYAAFRQMLARLQHTYQGLQREIQERQQIMEALRDNERQLCAAKDALECANTKLRHVNADKDKFFSILAHDLRNPLNSILAFGSLLENLEHRDAAERKLLTGEFQSLINNLLALLENLLTWSRIQRGNCHTRRRPATCTH